jgi:hypothetical protein
VWITLIIKRDHIEVMHEQFFISAFYWRALRGSGSFSERSPGPRAREFIALCCVIKLNSPLPGARLSRPSAASAAPRSDANMLSLAHRLFVLFFLLFLLIRKRRRSVCAVCVTRFCRSALGALTERKNERASGCNGCALRGVIKNCT